MSAEQPPTTAELVAAVERLLALAGELGVDPGAGSCAYPPILTVAQAADLLQVNRKTVYEAIQRRELPGVRRFGTTIRISRDALLTWIGSAKRRR